MATRRQPSIQDIGLKKYLNGSKERHNGFGYKEFYNMVNVPKPPSIASMGRIYGVSKHTMTKWLKVFRHEQGADETTQRPSDSEIETAPGSAA